MTAETLFRCTQCGGVKPRDQFWPCRNAVGVSERCRQCTFANARRDQEARDRRQAEAEQEPSRRRKQNPKVAAMASPRQQPPATKTCRCCGESKPLGQMSKAGKTKDGVQRYAALCKSCDAERWREWRARDPDSYRRHRRERRARDGDRERAAQRGRYWRNPEKARAAARARAASDRGRALNTLAVTRWQAAHPKALAAHRAVTRAKRRGELVVPDRCAIAGCDRPAAHAHHADYERPLDVLFVCARHHERLHHILPPEPA